jgi:hypothetical protein
VTFEIVLERRLHGVAFGTTRDVVEAETAADAERLAVAAWTRAEPRFTYSVRLTVQVQPCRGCGQTFPWSREADFCPECAAANAG